MWDQLQPGRAHKPGTAGGNEQAGGKDAAVWHGEMGCSEIRWSPHIVAICLIAWFFFWSLVIIEIGDSK